MGVGSVAGALAAGARGARRAAAARRLAPSPSASLSCSPRSRRRCALQVAALVPLGAASVTFAAGVNSSLQLAVEPAMRGRVMALYSVVFLGSTPIGAPLVGWLAAERRPARRAARRRRRGAGRGLVAALAS